MKVAFLCPDPGEDGSPNSAIAVLEELGCKLLKLRVDLADVASVNLSDEIPSVVIVDAGVDWELLPQARRSLEEPGELKHLPWLLLAKLSNVATINPAWGFADFLLTPLVPAEVYARLRHAEWRVAEFGSEEIVKIGELLIDKEGCEARVSGRRLALTHLEFALLLYLAERRGRVFSRELLLQEVWAHDYQGGARTVDIHIRRIRAKLGRPLGDSIQTVRGIGYKMS